MNCMQRGDPLHFESNLKKVKKKQQDFWTFQSKKKFLIMNCKQRGDPLRFDKARLYSTKFSEISEGGTVYDLS